MKRTVTIIFSLLAFSSAAHAVPAYPYPITVQQPDGTAATIFLHGDEFAHWATDTYGRTVALGQDGFVRETRFPARTAFPSVAGSRLRSRQEDRAARRIIPDFTRGNNHFLVMLIEFADVTFSFGNAEERFSDMLNKAGYDDNGGTGSAHDYFFEQSMGAFDPVFDVIGPIKVGGKMADYGGDDSEGDDKDPAGALEAACAIAVARGLVDFSKYDLDGNGYIDNIFFYYAGYSEAEGAGSDAIWPHAGGVYGGTAYNGVKIGSYACSAELRGTSGAEMTGIGVFCHEFGHVLGLPDFYDTDYGDNGQAPGLMGFSLMSGGSYNNNGCTPPNLTAIERNMLEWMDGFQEWTDEGVKTVPPISQNAAFITPTSNDGEFFVYEVRDGDGWDKYIRSHSRDAVPQGMLVYHVDKSQNEVGGITAAQRWASGRGINQYASHPCCAIVPAKTNYTSYAQVVFPGEARVREFSSSNGCTGTWDGGYSGCNLSDISYSGGTVTLNLSFDRNRNISGYVFDTSGNPIDGVEVTVSDKDEESAEARRLARGGLHTRRQIHRAAAAGSCVTGVDGKYSIDIPAGVSSELVLTAHKIRYQANETDIRLGMGSICRDITLLTAVEGDSADLHKYNSVSSYGLGNAENPCSVTAGVYFTADELGRYAGYKVTEIQFIFYCSGGTADEVSVFIDFDDTRQYTRKVDSPNFKSGFSKQDVAEGGITIPEGRDVVFGYALKNVTYGYPVAIDDVEDKEGYGLLRMDAEPKGGGWSGLGYKDDSGVHMFLPIVAVNLKQEVSPFASFGIKIIAGRGPYTAGGVYDFSFLDAAAGETPVSTVWYFDGVPQDGSSITLTAGRHEVKAVCTYADGSSEEIVQIIQVK